MSTLYDAIVVSDDKSLLSAHNSKKLRGETFLEMYSKEPVKEFFDTEIVDWGKPQGEEEW